MPSRRAARQLLERAKHAFRRVEPPCPAFGVCGGCHLQDLTYDDQLALKRAALLEALQPLGVVPAIDLVGLDDPWRYRSKMEFTFGEQDGRLVLGLHQQGSFWRIVDLEDCHLVPRTMSAVLVSARALARDAGLPAYNPRTHVGFFRHLILRQSRATGRVLVCLVTAEGDRAGHPARGGVGEIVPGAVGAGGDRAVVERWMEQLLARHPEIAGGYWGINRKRADVAIPDELHLVRGAPHVEERLGPFRVLLAPLTFLQPSAVQAERIYEEIRATAQFYRAGLAWDLYCGVGLVSFYLASRATRVLGIEVDERNLEAARAAAAANGITNVEFRAGKVEDLLASSAAGTLPRPGVIVIDPPRSGVHHHVIRGLAASGASQLFYLSCNAQTLCRDLLLLRQAAPAYRLVAVKAFDMFPQTTHVETLVRLERE